MGRRKGGIWKFSMNGLGTPRGAGPGMAKEKVGLAAVGTPGPVIPAAPVGPVELVFLWVVFLVFALLVFLEWAAGAGAEVWVSWPRVRFGFLKVEVLVEVRF